MLFIPCIILTVKNFKQQIHVTGLASGIKPPWIGQDRLGYVRDQPSAAK